MDYEGIKMAAFQDELEKIAKEKKHPVSEAQRRWAFLAEEEGELPKGKAKKWSKRVKGEDLPKHAGDIMNYKQIKQAAFRDELEKIALTGKGKALKVVVKSFNKIRDIYAGDLQARAGGLTQTEHAAILDAGSNILKSKIKAVDSMKNILKSNKAPDARVLRETINALRFAKSNASYLRGLGKQFSKNKAVADKLGIST